MKIKAKNIWVEYEIFGFTTFFLSVCRLKQKQLLFRFWPSFVIVCG